MSKESDFVDLLNKEMYELKIADLEAKLAEYEKFMKDNEWDSVEEMQETLNKCEKKYFDIQQELEGRKKLCDLRYKQLQNSHQDKISFAIAELEKVKELMRNIDMPNKPELYNNDMFGAGFDSHYIRVEKLIDNQINVLRNNKDGIH